MTVEEEVAAQERDFVVTHASVCSWTLVLTSSIGEVTMDCESPAAAPHNTCDLLVREREALVSG